MKKHALYYSFLIAIPFMAYILFSFSGGAPTQGVTGSPGDEANAASVAGLTVGDCLACHDGLGNFNTSVSITTNIPSGGYALSTKYQITVTITSTGAPDSGFQITAENAATSKVGVFSVLDNNPATALMLPDASGHFITQTFLGHEGVDSWTFDWTAPSVNVGAITFYVASVTGNGGSVTNTEVVFNTKTIGGVLAVNNARLLQFSMYPNPSDNYVTLQLPSGTNKANVKIFDYLGKTLIQKNLNSSNNNLDVSNLSAGIYFVRIQTDSKVGTKKLVVR
ncbi:MAG: T9SS type A sorting domain-containing protein [Flavobacteriaceae bacterium]